jgi:catechol 2,3-dioxygenase-like lactoylglutathione lyase family enzyme
MYYQFSTKLKNRQACGPATNDTKKKERSALNHLKGIHHVTAITSSAEKNYEFFTYVLGMRLVKKTVNQDDIQTYHLFFADDKGSAGTDMTFFDFPNIPRGVHGTNEIAKTSFRVPSDEALDYWVKRFDRLKIDHSGITTRFGKKTLSFTDFDDQQYQLISDEKNEGVPAGTPWQDGPVPLEYAITGLGPIFIRIQDFDYFKKLMEMVLQFKEIGHEEASTCSKSEKAETGHRSSSSTTPFFRAPNKASVPSTTWPSALRTVPYLMNGQNAWKSSDSVRPDM